jgi:hypothetical protein
MTEKNSERDVGDHQAPGTPSELDDCYDSYLSLADANLVIFVPGRAVPPFRYKAGGWELLQPSVELSSEVKALIAEKGYVIETKGPKSSGEIVARDQHETTPSLEIEFALVIARMIDSVGGSPENMRSVVYDLARYKLQEQLLHAETDEREHTQRALEVAIRGVEIFSEKHAQTLPPGHQSQPNPANALINRGSSPAAELNPQFAPRLRLDVEPNAGDEAHKSNHWSYLRRTIAIIVIVLATLITIQHREGLLSLAFHRPMPGPRVAVEGPSAPPLVSPAPPQEPASLLPTDYGVYATDNDALIGLSRVGIGTVLTTPSRTVLLNGHPKFIIFSRDLRAIVGDRAEVRILAKVAREFSVNAAGTKPAEDAWVIRNISFPFRSSPVKGNSEMIELHSDDPALELSPGRYALVLKTQAFDFSVEGKTVDPKHCVERIVGSVGIAYSNCKNL